MNGRTEAAMLLVGFVIGVTLLSRLDPPWWVMAAATGVAVGLWVSADLIDRHKAGKR